jgi:hypothetical protein
MARQACLELQAFAHLIYILFKGRMINVFVNSFLFSLMALSFIFCINPTFPLSFGVLVPPKRSLNVNLVFPYPPSLPTIRHLHIPTFHHVTVKTMEKSSEAERDEPINVYTGKNKKNEILSY